MRLLRPAEARRASVLLATAWRSPTCRPREAHELDGHGIALQELGFEPGSQSDRPLGELLHPPRLRVPLGLAGEVDAVVEDILGRAGDLDRVLDICMARVRVLVG